MNAAALSPARVLQVLQQLPGGLVHTAAPYAPSALVQPAAMAQVTQHLRPMHEGTRGAGGPAAQLA